MFYNTIVLFCVLENTNCEECGELYGSDILQSYSEFINENLIPHLESLCKEYSVWWAFKPDSSLKEYFDKNHIFIDTFFCPQQLFNAILSHAEYKNMFIPGNEKVVYLNNELQHCFNCSFLFIDDLFVKCLTHVYMLEYPDIIKLKHKAIYDNIYIETPEKIIYNDPSSFFWLDPEISFVCNYNKIMWNWNDLYAAFFDFCTTNKEHFTCINESFISINDHSILSDYFDFKYFHRCQIEDILKCVTKYLGKSHSFKNYVHFKSNVNPVVFKFIDYFVNNNKLAPCTKINSITLK